MHHIPNPPELIIIKTLWENGPLPMRVLHENCGPALDWSFSSTRKTVSRMIEKNMIQQLDIDGPAKFAARASKTTVFAFMTRDFMYRVLETDGPIPHNIYSNSKILSDDELDELDGLV